MGSIELTSAAYWESGEVDLRLNPRRAFEAEGLLPFLKEELELRGIVVMATSGSSGVPKFAILRKEALLASAKAVVAHLTLTKQDSWLAGLADFHVGGLGIYARAFLTGAELHQFEAYPWSRDGSRFLAALTETEAAWTSLTPTHLHDLVEHGVASPRSLRGLLLGGGKIEPTLVARARTLGWPVRASYGMTESSSQIATGEVGEPSWLSVLPGWELATDSKNRLQIRGAPLFSGYVSRGKGSWQFDPAVDEDGWFTTGDFVEVKEDRLRHLGRSDDLIKVLGELVSLSGVESRLNSLLYPLGAVGAIVAVPDSRSGHELVAVVETEKEGGNFESVFATEMKGLERPRRIITVAELPRTAIGKLDREALRSLTVSMRGRINPQS